MIHMTLEEFLKTQVWGNSKILGCFDSLEEATERIEVVIDLYKTIADDRKISIMPLSMLVTALLLHSGDQEIDAMRNFSDDQLRALVTRLAPADTQYLLLALSAMMIARAQLADREPGHA